MSIQVSLKEVWEGWRAVNILNAVATEFVCKECGKSKTVLNENLTAKDVYWFGKLQKKLRNEIEQLEQSHNKLVDKYGDSDPDAKSVKKITPGTPAWEQFQEEWKQVLDQPVEFDIDKVKIPPTIVGLTGTVMELLDPFAEIGK